MLTRSRITPLLVLLMGLAVAGCATPPDVQPFADATQALTLAVNSTASSARVEIKKNNAENADAFDHAWDHRIKAMEAMADYSDSLVAVVGAGNNGAAAAREVAGSVNTLLTTVSSAYPAGSAVTEAFTKGAVALYARFAKDRAAKTVAEVLKNADPAVREVAEVLADDFDSMAEIFATLRSAETTAYRTQAAKDFPVVPTVNSLRVELQNLRNEMSNDPNAVKKFDATQDQLDKNLGRPDYVAFQKGLKDINDRYDGYDAVVHQAADLTRAWGRSHGKLVEASESNRTPAFRVLVEMSREMLEIYREAKVKK